MWPCVQRHRAPPVRVRGQLLLVLVATTAHAAAAATSEELEFFEKKVRPLLAERCYKCHSAQSEKLKGGLRLDSAEGLRRGGDDGPVIQPGAPEKSKLIEAINYQNPDLQMPPKGKLSEEQIAVLTEWIRLGAPWPAEAAIPSSTASAPVFDLEKRRREHWAWQPIRAQAPPAVQNTHWPATTPDRFLLAKLEANHLQPAPPADRRVLIRRIYFDLIGLPPTSEEVDGFLADPSPEAYEKVVDRLLASPHFGERWARHWLDLVRYAETLGHEFDYALPNAWRYRDYVIRAFNADLPYDQFVTEHVAGDLLPNPRRHPGERFNESVIGTAFFWLGQREHSPVDIRQHQAEVIDNQIDVLSKTFLGLTVACARCHDHKFDAIPTRDFYALYGVLESSRYTQAAVDQQFLPQPEQLKKMKPEIRRAAIQEWTESARQVSKYLLAAAPEQPEPDTGSGTSAAKTDAAGDPALLSRWSKALGAPAVAQPNHPLYAWHQLSTVSPPSPGKIRRGWEELCSAQGKLVEPPAVTNYEMFAEASGGSFKDWFPDGAAFLFSTGADTDFIVAGTNHPMEILHEPEVNGSVLSRRFQGALRSPSFEIRRRYLQVLAAGRASRIKVCVDNFTMIRDPIYGELKKRLDRDEPTWLVFDLKMWAGHRAFIELCDIATPDTADDSSEGYGATGYITASRVVFSDSATPPPTAVVPTWLELLGPEPVDSLADLAARYETALRAALRTWSAPSVQSTASQRAQLVFLDWLVRNELLEGAAAGPGQSLAGLVSKYQQIEASIPEPTRVPGMADGDGVDEHVFIRGSHKTPGELAPRQFLTALGGSTAPFKSGSGRLELARCLTDASNPFLARVMVNRVWLHLFGRGIVPTPDDFGVLGQPPTHPELLDWLAGWYRTEAGWSTRQLIRLLVTSSAYRMSSQATDASAEVKDPGNAWFHRMPRKRLEGEIIRDAMLAVSGQLDDTMFGPPVATHLTEFMEGRGRPAAKGPLDGAGRRSIYLETRRNFLPPMMRSFDTPVPFTTIGKRTVSNVPAQSLILMNDPFVAEQARLWAGRICTGGNQSPEERITRIYLTAFSRPPTEAETAKALAFGRQQGEAHGLAAAECWRDPRVWTDLCHVAFNVKEFIFVE